MERKQRGKNKLKQMSVKMLMVIVVVEAQVPHKVNYIEEGTTRTGRAGYKVLYKFKKGTPENTRQKIPIFFIRHMMQHAINLEEEKRPDIG